MTGTRTRIADHVATHPGVHFNELVRTLDLAPGQVQYHLRRLRSDDRVVEEQLHGYTHYFTTDYDDWERSALALLRRETAGDVVAVLLDDRPARPAAVAAELDIARSTLEWHLERLMTHDIVSKEFDDNDEVLLDLERPELLFSLLQKVEPSVVERLTDRFTRLVDHLFEE